MNKGLCVQCNKNNAHAVGLCHTCYDRVHYNKQAKGTIEYICIKCGTKGITQGAYQKYCSKCLKEHLSETQRIEYRTYDKPNMTINRLNSYDTEMEALLYLEGAQRVNLKYDLNWKEFKVDVKACSYEKAKVGELNNKAYYSYRWRFSTQRQKGIVDYYLCIAKTSDGQKTEFVMLIPEKDVLKTAISVSQKNKHEFKKYMCQPFKN